MVGIRDAPCYSVSFDECMNKISQNEQLDPKQLLQVSMDGPSVNWKVYTDLVRERKTQELPELQNIGSRKVMGTV